MQVEFENLEPGLVVETPEVLVRTGISIPQLVYTGMYNTMPSFMGKFGSEWHSVSWPVRSYSEYGHRFFPLPKGFEVTEDKSLSKGLADHWRAGGYRPGENYASGCDPEIFVAVKDKVIPARAVLPKKSADKGYFYDGIQAEFTPEAGTCLEGLCTRIRMSLMLVQEKFRAKHPSAKLSIKNSVLLSQEEMDKLEDEDVAFQCSDSVNIYHDIPSLKIPRQYLWRFTGGHLHIGSGKRHRPVYRNMIRALDAILGVAGVSLARSLDNPERRKSYGRAGEARFPAHGLEYRVLSNFWLCSPVIYHLVFEIARWAYQLGEFGLFPAIWDGSEEETRECINNCDVALAQTIIKRNADIYDKLFRERWASYGSRLIRKAMDTLMNGVEVVVKDPADLENNWSFSEGENWGAYGGDVANSKWRNLRLW